MPAPLLFHLDAPNVQLDRCINARHRQAGCSLCVDNCPTHAITLLAGPQPLPQLHSEQCVGCGICIPVCPTDVFSQPMQAETKLLTLHGEVPVEENIVLICPQHPAPARSTAPARYAIRHQRCLAAFSPEQLLALSSHGQQQLWLSDDACAHCPLGISHKRLEELVQATNALLNSVGRDPGINLTSRASGSPHHVQVLDAAAPQVGRRGLFRTLGGIARQRVDEAMAHQPKPLFAPGAPGDARLPSQMPDSLQHLNQQFHEMAAHASLQSDATIDTRFLPWASLHLDTQTCSACQLCARLCPTDALSYRQGDLENTPIFNLHFQPAHCLDCNICVAVCPENAIHLTPQLPLAELLDPEPALLLADYLQPCQRCGTLTRRASEAEQTLCYACRPPTMYRQKTQRQSRT